MRAPQAHGEMSDSAASKADEGSAAGVLEIAGRNQRGEGLDGSDCADNGWSELWSDVGGGRWKQQ